MAANAIEQRRQKLVDERTKLEEVRAQIQNNLTVPEEAKRYVTTRMGGDPTSYMGNEIQKWIDDRLTEIERQLARLPFVATRRVASVVDALGRDLSQYAKT